MIAHERLLKVLHYDPDTGLFTWRVRTSRRVQIGATAGAANTAGYIVIRVDNHYYYAHRLAWLYMIGVWPVTGLDHRNEVKSDNRFDNLREADHSVNGHNISKLRTNNTTGVHGVYRCAGKFRAKIELRGRCYHLGYFDTLEAAQAAYLTAKRSLDLPLACEVKSGRTYGEARR